MTLRFSFAGSQELAAQVRSGAPADVIATADEKTMTRLAKYVVDPKPFVTNRLAIVVGKGNPKYIGILADLARKDVKVVLAGPTVPAGRYARQILAKATVTVKPKSEPTNVRQVLTPVRLRTTGEVTVPRRPCHGDRSNGRRALPEMIMLCTSFP